MQVNTPSHHLEIFLQHFWQENVRQLLENISQLEERILHLESSHQKSYLTQKEVISTFNIGHRTLKKWVASGLEEIWLDNRVYYDRQDIELFLNARKI